MAFLDILSDFIEDPPRAAAAVREKPPIGLGVAAYGVAALSLFLSQAVWGRGSFVGNAWVSLGANFLMQLAGGLLLSAVVHLVMEVLGGHGRVTPLFVLLGLSSLGWTLILPISLVLLLLVPGPRWPVSIFSFAVGLGVLSLKARSIAHNYGVPAAKGWFALGVPYMALGLIATAGLLFMAWGLVYQVIQLFS